MALYLILLEGGSVGMESKTFSEVSLQNTGAIVGQNSSSVPLKARCFKRNDANCFWPKASASQKRSISSIDGKLTRYPE